LLSMLSKKPLHLLARQPASRKSRRIAQAKAWAIDFQITHDSEGASLATPASDP
jgi:hypothetical protein